MPRRARSAASRTAAGATTRRRFDFDDPEAEVASFSSRAWAPREREIRDEILVLEEFCTASVKGGVFGAAATARAQIQALVAERARARKVAAAAKLKDPVKRLGAIARIAEEDGKWTAADHLRSKQADVEVKLRELEEAKNSSQLTNMNEDDLRSLFEEAISGMSSAVAEELLIMLERRLDRRSVRLVKKPEA